MAQFAGHVLGGHFRVVGVQYSGENAKRNVFAFGADFEDSRNIGKYFSHGPNENAPHLAISVGVKCRSSATCPPGS